MGENKPECLNMIPKIG